ncbi:MAG TPA: VOC family protein [Ktedonobacterales bacterium]|jgi:catechol 2,3-dioxygenase-like lactoylglutathione lyase family enzyme
MQFINVRLLVSDFGAAYAFWRDVMRLPVKYGPEMEGMPPDYAYFQAGDEAGIELMPRASMAATLGEAEAAPAAAADRQTALVFKVEDVDAAYADLVARGAAPVAGARDYAAVGIRTAHVGDPDGHLIEIYCPLAAPDASGAPSA